MRPLAPNEIVGNWVCPLLPIDEDERIDFSRLEAEVDYLVTCRPNGIYTNGTAGEFYAQTEEEFDRISGMVAEKCEVAGIPFQIGVSHPSAQVSFERLERVVSLMPGALQVVLPDWIAPEADDVTRFFERMAAAAGPIGLVLYNPPQAKRRLVPEVFAAYEQRFPGLVGLKVAGGDADWYARMRQYTRGLSVFVPGHHMATGVREGAAGAYSNVACMQPRGAQRWYELMQNDMEAALRLEARIRAFMDEHILPFQTRHGYSNPALDKLLAAVGGWADIGTRLRWPYKWIPVTEAQRLRAVARAMLPELFSEDQTAANASV